MVFQRKSAGKAKQQTPAKSKKSEVNDLDEMDMDFNSDSNDNQVMKKTPGKTPKGKQAQNDKRVSFQIPGKNTPSNKGTPKGAVVGKKQPTPAKVGNLKAFGGMAANSASKRNGKAKKAASDDDEDSEEDDEDDDDSELEGADLDMLLAGGDSEDDDDEDDDDEDDDDEDDDDEEEDEKASKNKKSAKINVSPKKKAADEDDDDDDDDDEEEDDDDDDDDDDDEEEEELPKNKQNAKQQKQSKNAQKKDSTPGQNKNVKQVEKSPLKKETVSPKKEAVSPKKTEKKEMNPIMKNFVELDTQRRRERDARTLYVGNLPKDIVATELKALSSDILAVNLPNHQRNKRTQFAFLEFASESKAEENFNILKSKKLRGEPLTIDFTGEKSKKRKLTELPSKDFNLKKLYVADIPSDGMISHVGNLFPKSIMINIAVRPTFKSATVLFSDEKDAAEALEAAKSAKIGEKPVTVVYSIQRDGGNKKKRKRANKGKQQQNQAGAKKMKLEVDSDDDDDDDDDDEE